MDRVITKDYIGYHLFLLRNASTSDPTYMLKVELLSSRFVEVKSITHCTFQTISNKR